jgi:hypothetical protein
MKGVHMAATVEMPPVENAAKDGEEKGSSKPWRFMSRGWFDAVFGVIAPILCLVFDPMVFTDRGSEWRILAFSLMAFAMVCLSYWLLRKKTNAFLGGVFAGAATFALLLGITILPLSLVGLFLIIGIFSFTPFVTSFVYARASHDAWVKSQRNLRSALFLVIGFTVTIVGPVALKEGIAKAEQRAITNILEGLGIRKLPSTRCAG